MNVLSFDPFSQVWTVGVVYTRWRCSLCFPATLKLMGSQTVHLLIPTGVHFVTVTTETCALEWAASLGWAQTPNVTHDDTMTGEEKETDRPHPSALLGGDMDKPGWPKYVTKHHITSKSCLSFHSFTTPTPSVLVAYLAGKEMATDFHKDLVVLIWSLVPRYNDLSARAVLQLVYLEKKTLALNFNGSLTYKTRWRGIRL